MGYVIGFVLLLGLIGLLFQFIGRVFKFIWDIAVCIFTNKIFWIMLIILAISGITGYYFYKEKNKSINEYSTKQLTKNIAIYYDANISAEKDWDKAEKLFGALYLRITPQEREEYILKAIVMKNQQLIDLLHKKSYFDYKNMKVLRAMLKHKLITHDQAICICENHFSEDKEILLFLNELLKWKQQTSKVWTLY